MQTQVTFRHFKSHQPVLNEMAIELAENFEKYLDGIIKTNIEFINEIEKTVEFTVHVNGTTLVVKESSEDFKKSLAEAADKMVRQLRRWKTKYYN